MEESVSGVHERDEGPSLIAHSGMDGHEISCLN